MASLMMMYSCSDSLLLVCGHGSYIYIYREREIIIFYISGFVMHPDSISISSTGTSKPYLSRQASFEFNI